jgi:hypothetical protein
MSEWLKPLWEDILRHIQLFDFGPPKNVEGLVAWATVLVVAYGFLRWGYRGLRVLISFASDDLKTVITAQDIRSLNRWLTRVEDDLLRGGIASTLQVGSTVYQCGSYVMMGLVLVILTRVGGILSVYIASIGIAFLAFGLRQHGLRLGQLSRAVSGLRSKITISVEQGQQILNREPLTAKVQPKTVQNAIQSLRKELPLVLKRLEAIRTGDRP